MSIRIYFLAVVTGILLLSALVIIPGAQEGDAREDSRGSTLARQYCTTCHLMPEPDQLPRETWPYVLDWMGNYLGYVRIDGPFANIVDHNLIPAEPLVSEQELDLIREYFISEAPEGPLYAEGKPTVREELPWFVASDQNILPVRNGQITMVKIDELTNRLFVGYANEDLLLVYDADGNMTGGAAFDTQPVNVETRGDTLYVTLIGDLLTDERNGQVVQLWPGNDEFAGAHLIEDFYRTAHAALYDLSGNGRDDIIVSGFGDFMAGRLSWFENLGAGQYREHVLLDHAGALKTEVHDFSGNGLPDIMALIAQGRQELLLYLNQGNGQFDEIQILQEFPGFGFHSFELADFNGNGLMDVLLINGNNMEIEDPPLRDYHGLRIYLNEGDLEFRKSYFYPMYGAIGASVADFTGNGLPDIAAVSFFPDWSSDRPEGFVFLEQTRSMEFIPRTHPATYGGRWMSIDGGDLNGDGNIDLVLGAGGFLHGIPEHLHSSFTESFNQLPPVMILINKGEPLSE